MKISKKLIIALILAIVAGTAVLVLWRQTMFSKEILRLEILGPETTNVGEEIEYTIKYKNSGNFVLESAKLEFLLPDNSLTEDGKLRISQGLEDIYPGQENFVKIKTRLLGKENDLKIAKASLTYIPKNITARYESNTTLTTKINSVPITLGLDLPTKAEKGKELQYSVNYFSNIDYPLENLSLKIEPVQGIEFISADPSSLDNLEWKLQTLNKAQGGRVSIKSRTSTEASQNLVFSAKLGMWQNGIFVVIKETTQEVQIIQPLLIISQTVNGLAEYIASPGEVLNYKIVFRNIGTTPFENLYAIVKLDGLALDMSTIQAENGQVQTGDGMVIFDYNNNSKLRKLNVSEEGEVNFSVKVKNDWVSLADESAKTISNTATISQISQKFTIKVNSGLVISQSAFYKSFEISNSGPTPPESGKKTTYVITWDIKNYFSDAKNVKVKAKLPANVSLTGKIIPEDASINFTFDSVSREIVWSAGDVLAGTGIKGDPVTLSFQIALTPSISQKGQTAPLIGEVQILGENQFTNTNIIATDSAINTSLPDDFANSGGGIVQ